MRIDAFGGGGIQSDGLADLPEPRVASAGVLRSLSRESNSCFNVSASSLSCCNDSAQKTPERAMRRSFFSRPLRARASARASSLWFLSRSLPLFEAGRCEDVECDGGDVEIGG